VLAARLAVSPRTLQRHCSRVLGVGPKWVVQRARIHDALDVVRASGGAVDWAALAGRLGFADQAHFTRTFTALVGMPPAAYSAAARGGWPPRTRPPPADPPADAGRFPGYTRGTVTSPEL